MDSSGERRAEPQRDDLQLGSSRVTFGGRPKRERRGLEAALSRWSGDATIDGFGRCDIITAGEATPAIWKIASFVIERVPERLTESLGRKSAG